VAAAVVLALVGHWVIDGREPPALAQPARLGLARSLPPGPTLEALADAIDAGAAEAPAPVVTYTRTIEWSSQTTVDGDDVTTEMLQEERETWWRSADGMRDICIYPGPEVGDGVAYQVDPDRPRPEPCAAGVPPRPDPDRVVTDITDDPVAAGAALGRGGPEAPGYRALENLSEIHSNEPLAPAERADLLRGLATLDGFEYRGEVVDRTGRPALAFASRTNVYGGDPSRVRRPRPRPWP
jgi:hypothetical protein